MNQLGRLHYTLISRALKCEGTYDPDRVLPHIEEDLTFDEAQVITAFLRWCHENGKVFGHGTFKERFAEFKAIAGKTGLKYAGFEIGQRIRAMDFEPSPDRPDLYIEGRIVAICDGGTYHPKWGDGNRIIDCDCYLVFCDTDSMVSGREGQIIKVPHETFMDYDGRVTAVS